MESMVWDILLQVGLILLAIFMFLTIHDVPKKALAKFRYRNHAHIQAKRHFVRGAQLLSQARLPSNPRSAAATMAKQAEEEADRAIALDPKDAAAHILKALSLDLQGFKTSALDSFDVALSPLAVKSLSERDKGDALFKRAELIMGMNRRGRVDSAIDDLKEAVKLNRENEKAFCLLGECYEVRKMREEAKSAFEEAVKLQPDSSSAREALVRLAS